MHLSEVFLIAPSKPLLQWQVKLKTEGRYSAQGLEANIFKTALNTDPGLRAHIRVSEGNPWHGRHRKCGGKKSRHLKNWV